MKLSRAWQHEVEERTAGRVRIKFYAGGVQGDERDVLRKIRLGQLSGGAITAIGLAAIDPEVRTLEIARTYEELDHLRGALAEDLRKKFDEKGFILLAWGDVGPVHIFSNRPIRSLDDLRATKLWMWSDDPITRDLFTALGIHGVPLGIADVLPALSTGAIDAFFSSPLGTLALQWSTHVHYATSMVIGEATGASVIAKRVWDTIDAGDRQILLGTAQANQAEVLRQVRADNQRALEAMRARGLQLVDTPSELEREFAQRSQAVATRAGATFSAEFRARVERLLDEYRKRGGR
jgi:TRAP-type C4-dicarboxylate transport system substrate-binding protein